MGKFCSKCGAQVNGKFCTNCGTKVSEGESEKPKNENPKKDNKEETPTYDLGGGSGKNIKQIFAIIMCVLFVVRGGLCGIEIFTVLGRTFEYIPFFFGFTRIFGMALALLGCIIRSASCIGFAYVMYLVYASKDQTKAKEQLIASVILGVIGFIGSMLMNFLYTPYSDFPDERILILVALVGLIIFSFMENPRLLEKMDVSELGNDLRKSFEYILNSSETLKKKAKDGGNDVFENIEPEQISRPGYIITNRTPAKIIILGIITCGIYPIFAWYGLIKDVNRACFGDGKNTAGIIKYIILNILTCGFYRLFWGYSLANRLQENGHRYGIMISENGTSYILWNVLGSFLCGFGPLIAYIQLISNCNRVFECYNRKNGYGI